MTVHQYFTNTTTQIVANVSNDTWVIAEGVYISTNNLNTIDGTGINGTKSFIIDGHLVCGLGYGMFLGDLSTSTGGNNNVLVSATGSINSRETAVLSYGGSLQFNNDGALFSFSDNGIHAEDGFNNATNNGSISADVNGINLYDGNNYALNRGSITAGNDGIYLSGGNNLATNTGDILVFDYGITLTGGSGQIDNSGSVSSRSSNGLYVSGGASSVINSGTVTAHNYGIAAYGGTNVVLNTGTLNSSTTHGIYANTGSNAITNTGIIAAALDAIHALGNGNAISSTGDITAGDHGISVAGTGNSIHVDGSLQAENQGIQAPAGANTIEVAGSVTSKADDAINVGTTGNTSTGSSEVLITPTGHLAANAYGIVAYGGANKITAGGTIVTNFFDGIYGNGDNDNIANTGEITAGQYGINTLSESDSRVANEGTIHANSVGIYAGASAIVSNTGAIVGSGGIYVVFDGSTTISNGGSIVAANDGIYVYLGNNVISSSGEIAAAGHGVYVVGSSNTIDVDGNIAAGLDGILATSGATTVEVAGEVSSHTLNAITVGTSGNAGTGSNEVLITATGRLVADDNGIEAHGSANRITNNGSIVADSAHGIYTHGTGDKIVNSGDISANYAIATDGGSAVIHNTGTLLGVFGGINADLGNNSVTNQGTIVGLQSGIFVHLDHNTVANRGTVDVTSTASLDYSALYLFNGTGNLLHNTGLATAHQLGNHAVYLNTAAGQDNKLINHGTLTAPAVAVLGGAGDETIINRGVINGDVRLGNGDDTYDGRHGELNSAVRGGAGNDTYIVDDPDITLIENPAGGTDLVKAASSFALGDNFENLTLIGAGDYRGIGNGLDNIITGNIGDNVLRGLDGNDTVSGGAGDDRIFGGAGPTN